MTFNKESEFELALINVLKTKGWEENVIKYPTEKDLIKNWANILYENNREIDRLNNYPLTDGEMAQIIEQINKLRTPLRLNSFINGKTVTIKRDNPNDIEHLGKEISLKIYDRQEIAAGQSRYQIVQQPVFPTKSKLLNDRRGDLMLLINGMPVIHIELKKSGVSVSEAYHQIEKYSYEGIFTGLFSLIQVFVAMTPDETVYFANAGTGNTFNEDYFFHWAEHNNERADAWKSDASSLLSIPMAHQLIGFYTVPDDLDGVLKVMRSYQYYASNAISDKVSKMDWNEKNLLGGYIWHTTGSGKTMTSFKSAQLIATSKDADKEIFIMDRINLGTQSVIEYRGFADEGEDIQDTDSTYELISKLKSSNPADTLIVTSIQKMSRIKESGLNQNDIDIINKKRVVFIVDECHRSTFEDMFMTIKDTFVKAIFFGFTGTPILDENQKKDNTTATVFGNELHRYSIADGIRDKNVLGFDIYKVLTYKDMDIRKAVALNQAKASTETEAISDSTKSRIYYKFMNDLKMCGTYDETGNYIKGIEDYLPNNQYRSNEHKEKVIEDILENWMTLSRGKKFSAIFATSSIPEAIEYYKILKEKKMSGIHNLNITALFDPSIDNNEGFSIKEDGLLELIEDYNNLYGQNYTIPTFGKMKKDISLRLAHKKPYNRIKQEDQIDLLIVVDQMLTGFDSKWLNTLYLDKILKYENIIQAFSRTNRLFGEEKPFGIIKYYRKPHTMEQNIRRAVKLYSGDKPIGLFVEKLNVNIKKLNEIFHEIEEIFKSCNIMNFEKLPETKAEKIIFASSFKEFNNVLESAKIQGFRWNKSEYHFDKETLFVDFSEHDYNSLLARYKDLYHLSESEDEEEAIPFDIDGYITSIDTGKIDSDYMNTKFEKYLRVLNQEDISQEELEKTLNELHRSYSSLSLEEQKYAQIFFLDIQSGEVQIERGKTFREYITEYMHNAENDKIRKVADILGLDENKLRNIVNLKVNENNINAFGRFDELLKSVDLEKAKNYLEKISNRELSMFDVNIEIGELLRKFILDNGFDIDNYKINI